MQRVVFQLLSFGILTRWSRPGRSVGVVTRVGVGRVATASVRHLNLAPESVIGRIRRSSGRIRLSGSSAVRESCPIGPAQAVVVCFDRIISTRTGTLFFLRNMPTAKPVEGREGVRGTAAENHRTLN